MAENVHYNLKKKKKREREREWPWKWFRVIWTASSVSKVGRIIALLTKKAKQFTWYEELIHWKRPWCWERLKVGGEGDNRGWDGWMPSPTQWTWVWTSTRSLWWTGRPGVLQFIESQSVRHDWVTELNWTELISAVLEFKQVQHHLTALGEAETTQTGLVDAFFC